MALRDDSPTRTLASRVSSGHEQVRLVSASQPAAFALFSALLRWGVAAQELVLHPPTQTRSPSWRVSGGLSTLGGIIVGRIPRGADIPLLALAASLSFPVLSRPAALQPAL